jgi:hypothetical protein
MKKLIIAAFATSMVIATPSFAGANPDSNGVNKNCFGQGRAEYSNGSTGQPLGKTGDVISDRAHAPSTSPDYPNSNVQLNKEYKAACQA